MVVLPAVALSGAGLGVLLGVLVALHDGETRAGPACVGGVWPTAATPAAAAARRTGVVAGLTLAGGWLVVTGLAAVLGRASVIVVAAGGLVATTAWGWRRWSTPGRGDRDPRTGGPDETAEAKRRPRFGPGSRGEHARRSGGPLGGLERRDHRLGTDRSRRDRGYRHHRRYPSRLQHNRIARRGQQDR